MKSLIENIIKNHKRGNKVVTKKYFFEDLEITIDQEYREINIYIFDNKINEFIKLKDNEFEILVNEFKKYSEEIILKNNRLHIVLKDIKGNLVYGYCRVSTKSQMDNNSLEQQEAEILSKYYNAEIFKECYTGVTSNREILNELIEELIEGDTLVVTKLDRLARNTIEGIEIIENLFNKGVSIHVLNIGLLENTNMGRFFITTLLAVAEMERNTIIERTQAGKAIAKQKPGFKEGRPKKYSKNKIQNALEMLTCKGGDKSYNEVAELTGISKSTLIRAVRDSKITEI